MPLPSLGIVERADISLVLRQCQAIQSEMKMETAIEHGQQMSLVKKHNREGLEEVLILLITKLVNSHHTSQKMSDDAIVDCAVDIVADYWYLKFEELVIIFNKLRKFKNFNKLDQSVIYEGIEAYVKNDRDKALEVARIAKSKANDEQRELDIEIIRAAYQKAMNDPGEATINKINKMHKDEAEEKRKGNNDFLLAKADWIKNNKK